MGGHSSTPVAIRRIKQYFVWPGLKKPIHAFVSSCQVCQQAKPERVKYPGLLQPLPIPKGAWQVVSLDFVEGLPQSKNMNTVLVVVNKFSKYNHFIPLAHRFTTLFVAQLYMSQVYKLHGMPLALISDRDGIFTSALWQCLFKLAGVDLKLSSAYHPQTDGQTEKVNQCMETFPFVPDLDASKQVTLAVLQKRLDSTGKTVEILVHWSGFPKSLATWENYDDLKRIFPGSSALELAETFGGGSVSSSTPETTETQNGDGARGPRRGQ
jgi:hypothetical protein